MQEQLEHMFERISRRRLFATGTAALLGLSLKPTEQANAQPLQNTALKQAPTVTGEENSSLDYFNLALRPKNEQLSQQLVDLAQSNFSDRPAGYLLGNNALPHITICQFRTKPTNINDIWDRTRGWKDYPLELSFSHLYISQDKKDPNLIWVGLAMKGQSVLSKLQQDVYNMLEGAGIKGTTLPQEYFPHVTWGRVRSNLPLSLKKLPDLSLYSSAHQFMLTFGQSNDIGVYSKQILPSPL